jgi:hypothetical protein
LILVPDVRSTVNWLTYVLTKKFKEGLKYNREEKKVILKDKTQIHYKTKNRKHILPIIILLGYFVIKKSYKNIILIHKIYKLT